VKKVRFETVCDARLTETWEIEVEDEVAEDPSALEDLLSDVVYGDMGDALFVSEQGSEETDRTLVTDSTLIVGGVCTCRIDELHDENGTFLGFERRPDENCPEHTA